ncbi:hypothetical protein ABG768_004366 [Culter alburnus]|uniref:Secreted protein n=1 Tax=Culter alburnus TaxID=194366 RepID=A0AAW1ZWS2_CULAL
MVAWPSGLRRWIKAPVSSGAWVRIPPLPRQPFRWLLWLLCLSKKDWRSDTACSRSLPWPHSTGFRASVKVHSRRFLYCCKTNGQNGAHEKSPGRVAWPRGLRRWIQAPVSSGAWVRIPPLPAVLLKRARQLKRAPKRRKSAGNGRKRFPWQQPGPSGTRKSGRMRQSLPRRLSDY